MRRIVVVLGAVMLLGGVQPAWADHGAGDLLNCADFQFQEDAQAHLQGHPDDPDRLDADNDGIACEHLPRQRSGVTAQVQAVTGYPPGPGPSIVPFVQQISPPPPAVRPQAPRIAFTGTTAFRFAMSAAVLLAAGLTLVLVGRGRRT